MKYDWRNKKTGEIREHDHWSIPPTKSGKWERVFSFGVARMEGGASPARQVRGKRA